MMRAPRRPVWATKGCGKAHIATEGDDGYETLCSVDVGPEPEVATSCDPKVACLNCWTQAKRSNRPAVVLGDDGLVFRG